MKASRQETYASALCVREKKDILRLNQGCELLMKKMTKDNKNKGETELFN